MAETYHTHAKGIRIVPGQWRPHYPFEQIAWVSPSWPSQDYLWLDFPEAIFTNQGLLYLSHVNPPILTVYHDLPRVPWLAIPDGITFDRALPNGVRFGGSLTRQDDDSVHLALWIRNESSAPLRHIKLQTCTYLRGIQEFAAHTNTNKYVHAPDQGWITLRDAFQVQAEHGRYRIGWRGGRAVADAPLLVTQSVQAERLVAMTWGSSTFSMTGNDQHPCMHADPAFPDLEPDQDAAIAGEIRFFEGSLAAFTETEAFQRWLC